MRGAVTGGRFVQVIHSGGCACRGSLVLVCCKQLMSERSELAPPNVGILLYVHSGKNTESSAHTSGRGTRDDAVFCSRFYLMPRISMCLGVKEQFY